MFSYLGYIVFVVNQFWGHKLTITISKNAHLLKQNFGRNQSCKCQQVWNANSDKLYEAGNNTVWLSSKEIFPSDTKLDRFGESNTAVETIQLKSESLRFFKSSSILSYIKDEELQCDENIFLADQNHSDLVSSKYEGGLKLWECTHDLATHLDSSQLSGKSVLDLGCGIGLLGILALRMNAETVHFQDYNADVLQYATIPNVHLNNGALQMSKCKFFSGDWESFAELSQFTCDLVLTSETIYNPANYQKLHNTIMKVLKPTGIALVAAKTYYFGVGGSTRQFEKLIAEMDVFNSEVVWKCSEGVQREILKLTFKTIM